MVSAVEPATTLASSPYWSSSATASSADRGWRKPICCGIACDALQGPRAAEIAAVLCIPSYSRNGQQARQLSRPLTSGPVRRGRANGTPLLGYAAGPFRSLVDSQHECFWSAAGPTSDRRHLRLDWAALWGTPARSVAPVHRRRDPSDPEQRRPQDDRLRASTRPG